MIKRGMARLGKCCRLDRRGTLRTESTGPMDLRRQKVMKVSPESQNDYTVCIGRSGMESPSSTKMVRKWNGRDPLDCVLCCSCKRGSVVLGRWQQKLSEESSSAPQKEPTSQDVFAAAAAVSPLLSLSLQYLRCGCDFRLRGDGPRAPAATRERNENTPRLRSP